LPLNRPPASTAEIASLPPRGTTAREAFARAHADTFAPETLVCLMRETAADGNTALFERLAVALVGRRTADGTWVGGHCEPIILAMAAWFGLRKAATLDDYRQECYTGMSRAIHAGATEKPFWEERFGKALKDLCIDEAHKMIAKLRHLEWADDRANPTDDVQVEGEDPVSLRDLVWDRIVEGDFRAAIRRLPPRQARAAHLTWIERLAVGSDEPRSVMRIMGITEQAVYALLAKAKAALAADPEIQKYMEDR
jgi:hypothetical protein